MEQCSSECDERQFRLANINVKSAESTKTSRVTFGAIQRRRVVTDALPAELSREISSVGFATLKPCVLDSQCNQIFDAFDELLSFLATKTGINVTTKIDKALDQYITEHPSPVVDGTVSLSMLKNQLGDYAIHSHQYFHGVYDFLRERIKLPAELDQFWSLMDSALRSCDYSFRSQILRGSNHDLLPILKVWKYTPVPGRRFLIPVHFDRSALTVIVHTSNPGRECLLIGPPSCGKEAIRDIAVRWSQLNFTRPAANAFPLVFPGLHADDRFGLDATPHAVEQVEENHYSRARFSLVFFLVPFGGADVKRDYVVPETELSATS